LEILQLVLVQDVVPFEMLAPTLHTGCVFRDIRFNPGSWTIPEQYSHAAEKDLFHFFG
jgi:hypothetical protein